MGTKISKTADYLVASSESCGVTERSLCIDFMWVQYSSCVYMWSRNGLSVVKVECGSLHRLACVSMDL
jgi:hypothetical protein